MTSRWVVEVTPQRDVPVRWRTYSLAIKNEGASIPGQEGRTDVTTRKTQRVVEAVWAEHGDQPIGRLYTEIGTRFHLQGDVSLGAVAAALDACGLAPGFIAAAEEDKWDEEVRASMAEATALVGDDVGVPVLVLRDGDQVAGISGPIVSPSPTGQAALDLWDHVVEVVRCPDFFELKRSRTGPPQVQPAT